MAQGVENTGMAWGAAVEVSKQYTKFTGEVSKQAHKTGTMYMTETPREGREAGDTHLKEQAL